LARIVLEKMKRLKSELKLERERRKVQLTRERRTKLTLRESKQVQLTRESVTSPRRLLMIQSLGLRRLATAHGGELANSVLPEQKSPEEWRDVQSFQILPFCPRSS